MPRPSSNLGVRLKLAFVGRRAELNTFEEMLWPATTPRYQVLSLSGVGGQGKTSLLGQFAQRMTALDCRERPICRLDFSVPQHRAAVEGLLGILDLCSGFLKRGWTGRPEGDSLGLRTRRAPASPGNMSSSDLAKRRAAAWASKLIADAAPCTPGL